MANYKYSSDLVADILFRAGESSNGSSDFDAVALQYLNRAYQALVMGGGEVDSECNEDWWWARKYPPGVLNLTPSLIDGTATVTNGSVSITLSSPPSFAATNYFFQTTDHPDIFRTALHLPFGSSVTLDAAYTGSSGTKSYRLFKAEYDIAADSIRVIAPMRVYQNSASEIDGVELSSLERDCPLSHIESGTPSQFAFITESKVRFNRFGPLANTSPNLIRVEYDYVYRPDDLTGGTTEEPIVPRQYRKLLADIALTFLFVDKNDDRAVLIASLAKKGLQAMVREQRSRMINYSRSLGTITPRLNKSSKYVRPLRTENGTIIG